jgi:predicted permease
MVLTRPGRPDFTRVVREHLTPLRLPHRRELKIVEELASQLEDACDALTAKGLSEQDALEELRRQLPDWRTLEHALVTGPARRSIPSSLRELAGVGLIRDLQSSFRLFIKDRGFTATTLLTLAICLGANAAIFTVVHTVLLRPLAFPGADRIVAMGDVYPTVTPNDILSNTAPSYFDRLEAITTLEDQALFTLWFDTIAIDGAPEEVRGMRATPSLFRLLGTRPALGRTFTDAEGQVGAEHKVILSHGLWQRLYGADPDVIGKDLRLGWTGQRYTIVGVMPRGFSFFDMGDDGHANAMGDGAQFWIPLAFTAAHRSNDARTRYQFFHVGRIREGATIEQVRAQLDALNQTNFKRFPELGLAELGMYTAVTPLQEALTRPVRRILYLLWGGAAFVLVIGIFNIANLCLARSNARARELATRLALGAGRLRITRQLVLEGLLLAGAGGLAAMGVAAWTLQTLVA